MSRFRPLLRPALLLAILFAAFATTARAEEDPKLPEGINALPNDLARRMAGLVKQTEKYRGLRCLHGVAKGSLAKDGLRVKMLEAFAEELPPAKLKPLEKSLKLFGLIPETMDLSKYYPELLTSQVGGFYDPRKKYLVIVQNEGGVLGKDAQNKYGKEVAERLEETVMVHEICHAIQDQHFDLKKFAIEDPLSDEGAGRLALIEGDATLTMYSYFSGTPLEKMPGVDRVMNQMFEDPRQLMEMAPDMPGSKEMLAAPAWFRDNLLFSYMQGFAFCLEVKRTGGQKLLDHAFKTDPPKSTEQILHPEKWLAKRDEPIRIELPDLSAALPGFTKIAEGQLGEQSIKVLLRETFKTEKEQAATSEAAAGWGGDRFAVVEKNGQSALLWATEWDTPEDAKQFALAAEKLNGNWKVKQPSDKRVQLLRGTLSEAEAAAAFAALATAKSTAPENKPLDLASLGIQPGAKQKADGEDFLQGIAEQLEKGGDVDLNKLLGDGKLEELEKELGGKGGALEGQPELAELMKNPAMQEMVKKMLSEERPKGKATEDGRGYTNEQLGFRLRVPDDAKEWKLNATPPAPLAVSVSDPTNEAQVTVVSQSLPFAMPIESMGPMLEMGPKMAMKDFKKISSGAIEVSGKKGWELQYEGLANGAPLRSTQRVFIQGNNMIVLSAVTSPERWATHEKAITGTLKSFEFFAAEKKETPAAPKN